MRIFLSAIFLFFSVIGLGQYKSQSYSVAYKQIQDLKNSVVFVRLPTQDLVLDKLKRMKQYKTLEAKKKEIFSNNKETMAAFNAAYTFTNVYFFYSRDSEKVRARNFEEIFLNSDLKVDSSIKYSPDSSFYVIDVGDIYFDAFGGHFEGMVVMDSNFIPLAKPFPFYVRKRSGLSIIKRTDVDMVEIFQREFDEFLIESTSPKF